MTQLSKNSVQTSGWKSHFGEWHVDIFFLLNSENVCLQPCEKMNRNSWIMVSPLSMMYYVIIGKLLGWHFSFQNVFAAKATSLYTECFDHNLVFRLLSWVNLKRFQLPMWIFYWHFILNLLKSKFPFLLRQTHPPVLHWFRLVSRCLFFFFCLGDTLGLPASCQ